MSEPTPRVVLVRHGETEWSVSGQHTGRTDIPLTPAGEARARQVGASLRGMTFDLVLTSPLKRARQTCDLAGFGDRAEVDPDLAEFDYGEYEGLTTPEILARRPGWTLYRDGCPGGESVADVSARVDRAIARLRAARGDAIAFAHGHVLRCLGARWVGLDASAGAVLTLSTASVSVLGYEHGLDEPAIRLWNDPDFRPDDLA